MANTWRLTRHISESWTETKPLRYPDLYRTQASVIIFYKMFWLLDSISGWGDPKPVTKLSFSCGRVAALISGRVFVYCCRTLLSGTSTNSSTTSTTSTTSQDSLLLVATRQSQPAVDDFVFGPNFLLTVGANMIVLFDFWAENTTAFSEFFSWNQSLYSK